MSHTSDDLDSACSTPYVSALSSPDRGSSSASGYFFSVPASPMHYVLSTASSVALSRPVTDTSSIEFEFSSRFSNEGSITLGSMSTADELFSNGQIRTMKLSSHLQRPQILAPLLDVDGEVENKNKDHDRTSRRGRDPKFPSRSMGRKARSLSPLRKPEVNCVMMDQKQQGILEIKEDRRVSKEIMPSSSASSSRSSSSGRNSKKWIFLKDLLYRSKSEGRGNGKEKFWTSLSFSLSNEKKLPSRSLIISREENAPVPSNPTTKTHKHDQNKGENSSKIFLKSKSSNGVTKRLTRPSAHELHYTANRAQAEEMKKRTYLPYKQGVFSCLGINSKGYSALNGFARTLNPVSSR